MSKLALQVDRKKFLTHIFAFQRQLTILISSFWYNFETSGCMVRPKVSNIRYNFENSAGNGKKLPREWENFREWKKWSDAKYKI